MALTATDVTSLPEVIDTAANDDKPDAEREPPTADVVSSAPESVRRGPGRPSKASMGQDKVSQVEANSRYRLSRELVAVQVPRSMADKLREGAASDTTEAEDGIGGKIGEQRPLGQAGNVAKPSASKYPPAKPGDIYYPSDRSSFRISTH